MVKVMIKVKLKLMATMKVIRMDVEGDQSYADDNFVVGEDLTDGFSTLLFSILNSLSPGFESRILNISPIEEGRAASKSPH
jgi:hypothetical protein